MEAMRFGQTSLTRCKHEGKTTVQLEGEAYGRYCSLTLFSAVDRRHV